MFQTNEMIVLGFLGESGVGKTHLIHRYLINSLPQKLTSTIAVEFSTGFYKMEDGTKLKIKIWDTTGQQKYKTIVCYHLKQVQAILIVYDITNEKSFAKIDEWLQKLQKEQIQNCLLILIGNKSDLRDSRKIKQKDGQQKAKQIGADFYELNAFDYEQVKQVFGEIIETLIERKAQAQINKKRKQQEELTKIKDKQQQLPLGIEDSGAADAVCSNCNIF